MWFLSPSYDDMRFPEPISLINQWMNQSINPGHPDLRRNGRRPFYERKEERMIREWLVKKESSLAGMSPSLRASTSSTAAFENKLWHLIYFFIVIRTSYVCVLCKYRHGRGARASVVYLRMEKGKMNGKKEVKWNKIFLYTFVFLILILIHAI